MMKMTDRKPSYLHRPMSSWETLETTMKRAEHMARSEEAGSGGHSVEHMSHTLLKLGQLCTYSILLSSKEKCLRQSTKSLSHLD